MIEVARRAVEATLAAGASDAEADDRATAMRVLDQLRTLDPDALTPREALEAIYALRKLTAS